MGSVEKLGLYGFAFPTGLNFDFSVDSGVDIEKNNTTRIIANYDNETLTNGWDYEKRILTKITSNGESSSLSFPM